MSWNGIFDDGVWSCGFDFDPTPAQIFDISPTGAVQTSGARFGYGYCWNVSSGGSGSQISFNTNLVTHYLGIAMFPVTPPTGGGTGIIFTWNDASSGTDQVTLRVTSSGSFQFYRGNNTSNPLGSPSAGGLYSSGKYLYLEAKVVIDPSAGVVELRLNGNPTPIISATGLNTRNSSNTWVSRFSFTAQAGQTFFDDWYMLDGTGSSPLNTYLGNIRILTDVPNANSAAGGHNQFTPTNPTNVNFSNVSSIPANTAKFNADATVNDIDFYAFPAFAITPASVLFINDWYQTELDTAGLRTIVPGCRSGGSDFFDTTAKTPSGGSWGYFNKPWVLDPKTSAAWTVSNAQSAELGIKINS